MRDGDVYAQAGQGQRFAARVVRHGDVGEGDDDEDDDAQAALYM